VAGKSRIRHPALDLEPKLFGRDDHTGAGALAEAVFDDPRSLILGRDAIEQNEGREIEIEDTHRMACSE
jgi:hypothetical protein